MSDNRDIKAEAHNRDKDRVIAASAGAVAGAAGIIAAQVSMQSDEEVTEQSDNNIAEVSSNTDNIEVCAVSNNEVIVCEVESYDSSEVVILATEIECSENEVYEIDTIEDGLLLDDVDLYFANTDDLINETEVGLCDVACECQIDGEISV